MLQGCGTRRPSPCLNGNHEEMTMTGMMWAALGGWAVISLVTGAIASGRGRDGAIWMLTGAVFGPWAILALLFFGNDAQTATPASTTR